MQDAATMPIPRELIRGANNFVLRVSGDSLECEGIRDGDYVVVAPERASVDGDTVLVEVPDSDGQRIRRLYHAPPDNVCLEVGNSAGIYPAEQVRIVGVVVGLIRKY